MTTAFWVFMIVTIICATIIIYKVIDEAVYLDIGDVVKAKKDLENRLDQIEKLIKEQMKKGGAE